MADFANLFLASYALKTQDENGKISLSRHFKSVINSIFEDLLYNDNVYEYNLIGNNDKIDIEEFMSKIKVSTVKKYWRDEFTYDLENDCLVTCVEKKRAEEEINKYDEDSVSFVNDIANCYIRMSKKIDSMGSNILKYIYY